MRRLGGRQVGTARWMLAVGLVSTLLAAVSCADEEPSSDAKSTSSASPTSPAPESSAPESSAPAASLDEVAQRLGGILQSEIRGADPGGAIVLVRIGEDERVVAAGLANVRPRTPLSRTSRFPIASVTKPMVATAVLRLINQGRLQLDDSLQQWLPGLVRDGDRITVAHLLSHQSGLPDNLTEPKPPATWEATIRATAKLPRESEPGEFSWYTNTNYILLGLIVEKVTGDALGDVLDRQVFTPARMTDTTLDTPSETRTGIVRGYDTDGKDVTPLGEYGWAAGGVVSTVRDVRRFFRALLAGDLIPAGMVTEMVAPRGSLFNIEGEYGLGIWHQEMPCGPAIGHSGLMPGYAIWAYTRESDSRFAVVMTNNDRSDRLSRELLEAALCD